MISSEVETFARTGGLGDAVYGLSRALARAGHEVAVITPLYGNSTVPENGHWWYGTVPVRIGWQTRDVGVYEVSENVGKGNVRFCLLGDDLLFGLRHGIYADDFGTFGDNDLRFAVLSKGALEIAWRLFQGAIDVVHSHDWHAALAPIYARGAMGDAFARVRQVFTIHNLAYQGILGLEAIDRLGIPRQFVHGGGVEHFGDLNLVKGAVALSDSVTAVSPTYAREIQTPEGGFGLDGFLRGHSGKIRGIVNGIDLPRADPATDPTLAERYGIGTMSRGRAANKAAITYELGLDDDGGPIFGVVSRLTAQKGIDLLMPVIPAMVDEGARFALVGTGEPWLEQRLREMAWRFPGRVAARIAFDRALAQRMYAGADFIVVPSRFEPCGLTQLYAMRYGAIPVVSGVGGLRDTVEQANLARQTGTGFIAPRADTWDMLIALEDALTAYRAPKAMHALRERAMKKVFSWDDSARSYLELYS